MCQFLSLDLLLLSWVVERWRIPPACRWGTQRRDFRPNHTPLSSTLECAHMCVCVETVILWALVYVEDGLWARVQHMKLVSGCRWCKACKCVSFSGRYNACYFHRILRHFRLSHSISAQGDCREDSSDNLHSYQSPSSLTDVGTSRAKATSVCSPAVSSSHTLHLLAWLWAHLWHIWAST